jgi:hypothetical protein
VLTPAEVRASTLLTNTVIFSVGCHSGFAAPDEQALVERQLDFAQVLVGQGAVYVANTGFGYGDADAIGYSERLMMLFVRHLRTGVSVGAALHRAKLEYFTTLGVHSLTPYDEKVLNIATLYGLPQLRIIMPIPQANLAETDALETSSARRRASAACPAGLTCQQVVLTPTFLTHTTAVGNITGTYYSLAAETQVNPGQPIQPRTTVSVTLAGLRATGKLFEGGVYETFHNFDPVVTRVITEDTRIALWQVEPTYDIPAWTPPTWAHITSQRTANGLHQQLVVIPAQYRARGVSEGDERRFSVITYTLYYSTTQDLIPPSLWTIETEPLAHGGPQLSAEATDFSGVTRVVVAYTAGDGVWRTVDLALQAQNRWAGTLPVSPYLEYFVQAVDSGGNVAIHDNKGQYFVLTRTYLPAVYKGP